MLLAGFSAGGVGVLNSAAGLLQRLKPKLPRWASGLAARHGNGHGLAAHHLPVELLHAVHTTALPLPGFVRSFMARWAGECILRITRRRITCLAAAKCLLAAATLC